MSTNIQLEKRLGNFSDRNAGRRRPKRPAPGAAQWCDRVRKLSSVLDLGPAIHNAEGRIEDQLFRALLLEIEHVVDRAGRGIERTLAETLALEPVVLDELRDRGLRDQRVADIVLLGVGRDHQERL